MTTQQPPRANLAFTTREIDGNWHMVRTENGKETTYPAGTERHANMMVSLARTDHERAAAGLPPIRRG